MMFTFLCSCFSHISHVCRNLVSGLCVPCSCQLYSFVSANFMSAPIPSAATCTCTCTCNRTNTQRSVSLSISLSQIILDTDSPPLWKLTMTLPSSSQPKKMQALPFLISFVVSVASMISSVARSESCRSSSNSKSVCTHIQCGCSIYITCVVLHNFLTDFEIRLCCVARSRSTPVVSWRPDFESSPSCPNMPSTARDLESRYCECSHKLLDNTTWD